MSTPEPVAPAAPAPAPTPAQVTPPAAPAVDPLAGLTAEQVDDLAAKIDAAKANRPAALSEQLATLEERLTGAHREKDGAVEKRKEASTEADEAVALIREIKETQHRTLLTEAATAAGFKAPSIVAAALAGQEGDVASLVAAAAASGAYAMNTPAQSAQIGGPGSQVPSDVSPGRAGLMQEILEATGRA